MEQQMEVQLETCNIMITSSKALAHNVSANMKGVWKKIPSMYKNVLFTTNLENGETLTDKIRTQGKEIFDANTNNEAHSIL